MRFLFALLVCLFASSAHAVFTDLTVVPSTPAEGQPIGFAITSGGCDLVQFDQLNAADAFRTVTIVGHQVDVTVTGMHSIDSGLCTIPLATPRFMIGSLTQGSYTLNLHFHDAAGNLLPQDSIVASTTFAVSAPAPIPATNANGALALILCLIALAVYATRLGGGPGGNRSMSIRHGVVLILLQLVSPLALAGTWTISSSSGQPGEKATINVSMAGDSRTVDTQVDIVFDESRLTLPVSSGALPKAAVNGGNCARVSSNLVRVLLLSPDNSPRQIGTPRAPGQSGRTLEVKLLCSVRSSDPPRH